MTQKSHKAFLLAAGGTGGHIIPACRIALYLKESYDARILFLGGKKGLESTIVPKWGFDIETVDIMPMPRTFGLDAFRFPFNLLKAVTQAKKIIREFNPDVIISTGGFASGPSALAAPRLKIPLVIQEQNSYPGITQRWASMWAEKVYYAFPGSEACFLSNKKAELIGNPIDNMPEDFNKPELMRKLNLDQYKRTIFVTGGSQGSVSINKTILKIVKKNTEFNIIWQTGGKNHESVMNELDGNVPDNTVIEPFIQDMVEMYMLADLVICRAGALTLAEIAALGKPSILIPFPYAAGDHQTKNAKVFERTGASMCITDDELSHEMLVLRIKEIVNDPSKLGQMSRQTAKLGKPDALRMICNGIYKLAMNEKDETRELAIQVKDN